VTLSVDEADLIPLSALQHYLFCPRQCALIHIERLWAENVLTAEGRILHERSDKGGQASRGERRIVQSMPIRSRALGVAGIADVVELFREGGRWRPYPIEYKRGRPKAPIVGNWGADEVQLCAQALCLEEMLSVHVPAGALFYGKVRRRHPVAFDEGLRALTHEVAAQTRALLAAGRTPPPIYERRRCDACSLKGLCQPKRLQRPGAVAAWLRRRIEDAGPPAGPATENTS
jgi:CRISPR-associated exonuclease Cas4